MNKQTIHALDPINDEEKYAINRAIASDPDTFEPADGHFAQMTCGRPDEMGKQALILDAEIAAYFAAGKEDWRTAVNGALPKLIDES